MKKAQKIKGSVICSTIYILTMGIAPSIAQQNTQAPAKPYGDRFASQRDAEARAKEIGCNGAYRNGQFWMPCGSYMMYSICWDRVLSKIKEMAISALDQS